MSDDLFSLYQRTLATLDQEVADLQSRYRPQLACQKGCSGCCRDNFTIRYVEAFSLLQGVLQAPPEIQRQVLENLTNPAPPDSEPDIPKSCPLLVNNACAVYNHRPALCRAYGLILHLKGQFSCCPLNFTDAGSAPKGTLRALDLTPFYEVLNDLSQSLWAKAHPTEASEEAVLPMMTIREFLQYFQKASLLAMP